MAVVDWIFVELRSADDSSIVVATTPALVLRDGNIIDMYGAGHLLFFDIEHGYYYISVRHRNHLGMMTAQPVELSCDSTFIDFTDPQFVTFGSRAQNLESDAMTMWWGDVVNDGEIRYAGVNNDRDPILVRIGGIVPTEVVPGYFSEDVNLDGVAKYAGIANDRDLILTVIGGSIPTASKYQQLP